MAGSGCRPLAAELTAELAAELLACRSVAGRASGRASTVWSFFGSKAHATPPASAGLRALARVSVALVFGGLPAVSPAPARPPPPSAEPPWAAPPSPPPPTSERGRLAGGSLSSSRGAAGLSHGSEGAAAATASLTACLACAAACASRSACACAAACAAATAAASSATAAVVDGASRLSWLRGGAASLIAHLAALLAWAMASISLCCLRSSTGLGAGPAS